MSMNSLTSLKLIQLSMSILNDDLDQALLLVSELNEQPTTIFGEGAFNLYDFFDNKNETFNYVVNNLTTYPNIEKIRWDIQLADLLNKFLNFIITKNDVNSFAQTILNTEENLPDYKLAGLIRLANTTKNYDLLSTIKNKVINNLEAEEV